MSFSVSLALLAVAIGSAGSPLSFHRLELAVPMGRIGEVAAQDIDGDGQRDLIATVRVGFRPDPKVYTAFFLQHSGDYPAQPSGIADWNPSGIAQDTGSHDGRPVWCVLDREGVLCMRWEANGLSQPERVVRMEGMALLPEEGELPWLDFLNDWDGDGEDEVGLAALEAFHVLEIDWKDSNGYRETEGHLQAAVPVVGVGAGETIPLRSKAFHGSGYRDGSYDRPYFLRTAYQAPRVYAMDFNRDGRRDWVGMWMEHLWGFERGTDGTVPTQPGESVFFDILTEAEKRRGGADFSLRFADIDGDGVRDVLANKVSGGLREMRSVTRLHLADPTQPPGWRWRVEPDQELLYEGYAGQLQLVDWNSDGMLDLIVPNVSIGIWEMVRILTTGELPVSFSLRLFRDGRFQEGRELLTAKLPVDLRRGATLDGLKPLFGPDFNGDGRPDAVTANGGELNFHLADAEGELESAPSVEVETSPWFAFPDLDGDGRADVLGYDPDDAVHQGRILLMLSRPMEP